MTDRRRAKWHDEAIEMKRSGFSIAVIANKFGVSRSRVTHVTSGVRNMQGRGHSGAVSGARCGHILRVAIGFTDDQIKWINSVADREGQSFSLTVSRLIETVRHSHGVA